MKLAEIVILAARRRSDSFAPHGLFQFGDVDGKRPRLKVFSADAGDLFRYRGNRIDRALSKQFGKGGLLAGFGHIHTDETATADGVLRDFAGIPGVAEDFYNGPRLWSRFRISRNLFSFHNWSIA